MARIVTGIQSSKTPHLGNLLGALIPAIEIAKGNAKDESLFFIADLHTLTSNKKVENRNALNYITAAAWLSCGLNTDKTILFRQSRIPAVCELAWYLSCFTQYPMLANAHAFKDKASRLYQVNAGLFTYPILMAADILLYEAQIVPVGRDQIQHIEITRDIAKSFNFYCGDTFLLPQYKVIDNIDVIIGTDGKKMSKSYGNTIDIFLPEKELKNQIMNIKTDSRALKESKDFNTCNVFSLYKILASREQVNIMQARYLQGGYGYGEAKKELFALLMERFAEERKLFGKYLKNTAALEVILQQGEQKAQLIASTVLEKVRSVLGYSPLNQDK